MGWFFGRQPTATRSKANTARSIGPVRLIKCVVTICFLTHELDLFDRFQLDRSQIADGAGGTLVFRDYETEWAGLGIKRDAVHGVGDQDFSGMKGGIDFGQGEDCLVAVGSGGDNVAF